MATLIVGLGNIGANYANNRHNVGFLFLDTIAAIRKCSWSNKFSASITSFHENDEKIYLLKPHTLMNSSGTSVLEFVQFYKLSLSKVFVIHDELDLPFGKIKIKQGCGSNGHNGLKDIDKKVGKDYWRCKIGIGRPADSRAVANYVLSNFSKKEIEVTQEISINLNASLCSLLGEESKHILVHDLDQIALQYKL